jgi:RHS repeat-associated protein
MALALLIPLAMPASAVGDTQLHLPSAGSIRSAAVSVVDFLTGHHAPAPKTPKQQSGTAAGHAHSVPAAVTRAVADAMGRQPHAGRGQRPAYQPHGLSAHQVTTGEAHGVFNAKTSTVVPSATTAKSVLYKNTDGSYTRHVYPGPVNYKTSSGAWAPINENLVHGSKGRWQEAANSVGASFAATGSQALGTLTADNGAQSVSFSLAGASSVAGVTSGSSVTYPGILPQTDVTENATATGISETLTLHSAAAGPSWVFPLQLTGLTPVLDGDAVDLKDSAGNVVWVIPPAVARSGPVNLAKANSQASSLLTYQLVPYNGATALEMTLDKSWLDAPGRVFPVVIDPTISPNAAGSTYVQQLSGTNQTADNGGSEFLPSGTVTDSNGTFEDIDFLSMTGEVGSKIPDQHVTSASLNLFDVWAYQCTYSEEVYAYQVTSSWSPGSQLTYPGPSYGTKDAQWTGVATPAMCDNTSGEPGMGTWISLGFNSSGLSLLNGWTLGTVSNYGFAVAPSLTDEQMWKQFDSANDGAITSSQGGDCVGNCEPYLSMTYTADTPPQIDHQYPPSNYNSATLTPELIASGHDPDSWPNALKYDFTVYNSAGTKVADSGEISGTDWTVPSGDLTWGQTYYWTVQDYDGVDTSTSGTTNYFSTPVPQPLVTSGLSQNENGPGYDAGSGNYTTSSTDAQVPTVGPALEITRDYNSQDPRLTGAFGAGWSSVLDMKVAPGQNNATGTTATEVVTYPDGEEVAFGKTSSGAYVAPPGRYATLAAVSGGFTLTDKNDTVYTFTQSLPSGGYGITSIADALGHTETFTWTPSAPYEITQITSASGRTLGLTWVPAASSGPPFYPHVSQVVTQDVTPGDNTSALTWQYNYSGDELSSVCPPADSTHCTTYAYKSGSDYPESVLDSGPASYWRLDETSGTTAASSVMLNEGADNATYSGATLGTGTGPLAGSSATPAAFNGTSSEVTLPQNLVSGASYQSVSMWFNTTTPNGVLFSYQNSQLSAGTTTGQYTPSLYIGSDGKLYGQFWQGGSNPMATTSAVTDGKWHLVTLTAAGNTQTLYLDGVKVTSLAGTVSVSAQANDYIGAGFLGGNWPNEANYQKSGNTGYATYFNGDISDVGFWTRPLTGNEVTTLYGAGTHQADLLTGVTRPSGKVYATVTYDPLTGRTTSVTDDNGGTWTLNSPTVGGSSQVYVASVLGNEPLDYWRLGDSGTSDAVNQVDGGTATYNQVGLGAGGGPFADTTTARFGGSPEYLQLPQGLDGAGSQTVSLWFRTGTAGGVLLSSSADAAGAATTPSNYTPILYIGSDGYLHGKFWDGSTSVVMHSTSVVDDSEWHNVVLTAGSGSQDLLVDGVFAASESSTVTGGAASGQNNIYAGTGFVGGNWPNEPHQSSTSSTGYASYFQGYMGELAFYPTKFSGAQVTAEYNAWKNSSGSTPTETETVTDPGNNTLTWVYDLLNGGRVLSQTDARGQTTTYGYDVDGFQNEVVNPDGDYTQTGYDVRGNVVSTTTCQDQSTNTCSTSYDTYYPDDTSSTLTPDVRNDVLLTSSDGRSASSTGTTYQTKYAYNSLGELISQTTPPVAGFSSGRTTSYLYTDGTTANGGYQGAIPPKGLQYQVTTPGSAVTKTLYYANGDVAEKIDPDGLQTVYADDGVGREASETQYSDSYPNGLETQYVYNKNGQVVTETDAAVTDRVTGAVHTAQTATVYDVDGNVTSQTVADTAGGDTSRTVNSTYDAHDMLASENDANGNITSYTYDAYGNKQTETDADNNVTQYTYDGNGDLLTTSLENYTGSPAGSQTAAALPEESRSYDPAGRLASVTDSMGRVTNYAYTDNGLLASITESTGTQTFTEESDTFDAAGNLIKKVTDNGATTTNYTVDAADRTTQQVLDPSGLNRTTTISYTPDDQQSSVTESGPSGATQATSYTYDPNGNETSESVTQPGAGAPVAWYPLTQTSGTSVPDSATGGQPATNSGATWTGSNGASFTGTVGQQIATSGPALDTTGSFSVAAWVNLAGDTTLNQTVVSQDAGTDSGFYLKYFPSTGGWEFARPHTDTTNPVNSNANAATTATTGTWYFLTGTYNASTGAMTLYVNGASAGSGTDSTPIAAHGPLAIGRSKWNGSDSDWLDGSVEDVQAYPRALSSSDVSALYALGRGGGDVTTGKLTTSWTLDKRGLPTSMTDPDGNVTSYSYDEAGQLAQTTQPPVSAETYGGGAPVTAHPESLTGYDTFGDTTENEDPNGKVTNYGYDADGQEVSQTLPPYTPPGSSTPITAIDTKTYDHVGQLSSETDALGKETSYAYDQLGDLTSETDPDGGVTSYTYDSDSEQLSQTSPTGAQTQKTYDFLGRDSTSTQVERYTGSGTTPYTTHFTYGTNGWLATSQTPGGAVTSRLYDAAGGLTQVTDPATNVTKYAYDDFGRQTGTTNPDSTSSTTAYDASGDVTSTSDKDASGTTLSTTSSTYDGDGNALSSTDALGNATTFTYDPSGSVTQEVQPVSSSSGITVSFGYDAAGNETRYTDGNGSNWYYTYNSWGLPESRVEPATTAHSSAGDSTYTTVYDADGHVASETEPGGVTVTDSYNGSGELTGESGTGADAATATRTLGYNTAGQLTSAATTSTAGTGPSNATSESFSYNDRGQVLTSAGTAGSTAYGYNGDGLVTSVADAAGTTSYAYDSADRLHTLSDPATGKTATYTYNSDNMVSQVSYGSDVRTLGYDSLHRLTGDTLKTSSGSTVASVGYGYDADSRLTALTTTGLAGASANAYTYDQAGRVASWNNGTTTTSYGYDGNGNLTQDGSKAYTYDARDELTSDGTNSYSYTARGTLASQSSSSATVASSFDAFGDQVTQGTQTYATDALGRMTSATGTSGPAYSFSYAGASGSVASDGVNTYTWDPSGSSLAGIGAPGGGTGGVLALTNIHGDVIGQFSASGTSVSGSTGYDPWGNVTASSGTVQGRLGFQSGWTDPATGKVAMGARWYTPSAGGFDSADTVAVPADPDPAMADPFAYVGDDPLDGTDPSGHCGGWMSFACSVVHTVSHAVSRGLDTVRRAAVSAWDSTFSFGGSYFAAILAEVRRQAAAAERAARSVVHHVYDAARWGVHAYHSVVHRVTYYAARTYHAATRYAVHAYHRVVHAVRTVYHAARRVVHKARDAVVRAARSVAHHVAAAAKSVAHHAAAAGVWVGRHVDKAASVTAHFAVQHAAAIGGAVTGIAVFAGCEAATGGAGSLACAAASGAAANAVSYAITAAQKGSFSWSALGETTAEGAVEGLAGGALGEVASAAGGVVTSALARDGAEEATSMAGEDAGQGLSCGGESFTAATGVLLASGKTVPISGLKVGDKVKAVNTKTGKAQVKTVQAVMVHYDTDLYDLMVKTARGTRVIDTTSNHLFWDPAERKWVKAASLKHGEHLRTANGTPATADGGHVPASHDGWMWDLTIQDDHDFYVLPAESDGTGQYYYVNQDGVTAVLVHNCDDAEMARMIHDAHPDEFLREHKITVGVMTTDQGRFAAQAASEFTEEQAEVMAAHGIEPRPFIGNKVHAERQLLDFAQNGDLFQEGGQAIESMGASRDFCGPERADCTDLLQKAGATIVNNRLARW